MTFLEFLNDHSLGILWSVVTGVLIAWRVANVWS